MTRAISGIRASAWPRFMRPATSCASSLAAAVSSTAAAQASSAVSMARISMANGNIIHGERPTVLAVMAGQ